LLTIQNSKHHVLIADQNLEFAESLKTLLILRKIAATITNSGMESLNLVYDLGVDLLVPNTHLLEFSGYDLSETLSRGRASYNSIPIVMLSNDMTLRARLRGFLCGALRYVCRPVDIKELFEAICRLLPDIAGPAPRRGAPSSEVW